MICGLFVAVAAVQLATPLGQIWKHEDILRTGVAYKFRTAPVDPYDAFRGRYVALNYANTVAAMRQGDHLGYRAPAYVTLQRDPDGFAQFGEILSTPPTEGDYVRVKYFWSQNTNAHFGLPFDKFFMNEKLAPQAEDAYRRFGNRRGQTNNATYALIRVKGGRGIIEDLYIKDQPVRDFLKNMPAQP